MIQPGARKLKQLWVYQGLDAVQDTSICQALVQNRDAGRYLDTLGLRFESDDNLRRVVMDKEICPNLVVAKIATRYEFQCHDFEEEFRERQREGL